MRRGIAAGATGLVLLVGGATMWTVANASTPSTGAFNDQAQTPHPTCLVHQKVSPAAAYTAGENANTGKVLRMMRYYTGTAGKPFCDGQRPTATDQAWAQLYQNLGGDAAKVRPILGAG